ncbi:3-oxoacyl-[acyl-carrier-protein] reductase FabG-like [Manduca sexta]|uniref:3-oxoacyl-[acyl-carrier-protein] reductase FabG-like n=1 Tax=Manduca sexta TaxID=7130 RepID=UPI00188E53DA|nr:3-oxoacyl-[acyl-carrier-protein] reductase FabG-like [Manduca sexta]
MSFAHKVVLITGGGAGIGAATALAFAKEGAKVVIVDRNKSKVDHNGNVLELRNDISHENQAVTVMQRTLEKFGKLDILVNNAAVLNQARLLQDNFLQAYDEVMATNLRAAVHLTRLAAPHLIKTKGNIINISSIGGIMIPSEPAFIPYYISKAGLNHFTKAAALELAPYGVRVNAISPGIVNTHMLDIGGYSKPKLEAMTALKRIVEPEEIADLIMFVASDKAKSVTGSNYVTDNGMSFK